MESHVLRVEARGGRAVGVVAVWSSVWQKCVWLYGMRGREGAAGRKCDRESRLP